MATLIFAPGDPPIQDEPAPDPIGPIPVEPDGGPGSSPLPGPHEPSHGRPWCQDDWADRFDFDFKHHLKDIGDRLSDRLGDLWDAVPGKGHWGFICDGDDEIVVDDPIVGDPIPIDGGDGGPGDPAGTGRNWALYALEGALIG